MIRPYRSDLNRTVPLAGAGEFQPLVLGSIRVWPPVVLAPMAAVTNPPFRTICRRYGAGLYVSEMITARGLTEGNAKSQKLASFAPDEDPRSLQLYGTDPYYTGEAVALLVGEGRVDHIDLNFGCPVRKVTRRGGGAAIPLRPNLLRRIVRAAVAHAEDVPVTIKFRIGTDDDRPTFLDSGRIAEEEGCAAVALHARTAAQLYEGEARWEAIGELKQAVTSIPVLGNGDIWEAHDALRMMRATACDGVVIGRGCLGRPWLFRDLVDVFEGREPAEPPRLGEIAELMIEHATLLSHWLGEYAGMRAFRKHGSWYTKGFPRSTRLRERLMGIESLNDLSKALSTVNPATPFPLEALRVPRGKRGGTQRVVLPRGYLDDLETDQPPGREAEQAISGG